MSSDTINTQDNNETNVVGIKVLEKNGVDVKQLVDMLVYNASVEFAAYYYFTNLRMHCTGFEGESIKGIIEDARMETLATLNHAFLEYMN